MDRSGRGRHCHLFHCALACPLCKTICMLRPFAPCGVSVTSASVCTLLRFARCKLGRQTGSEPQVQRGKGRCRLGAVPAWHSKTPGQSRLGQRPTRWQPRSKRGNREGVSKGAICSTEPLAHSTLAATAAPVGTGLRQGVATAHAGKPGHVLNLGCLTKTRRPSELRYFVPCYFFRRKSCPSLPGFLVFPSLSFCCSCFLEYFERRVLIPFQFKNRIPPCPVHR